MRKAGRDRRKRKRANKSSLKDRGYCIGSDGNVWFQFKPVSYILSTAIPPWVEISMLPGELIEPKA